MGRGGGGGGSCSLANWLPEGLNRVLIQVTHVIGHVMYVPCRQLDNVIGQYAQFARHFFLSFGGGGGRGAVLLALSTAIKCVQI